MQPQTTLVSPGTQRVKVEEAQTIQNNDETDEKEDEDEKKRVSLI